MNFYQHTQEVEFPLQPKRGSLITTCICQENSLIKDSACIGPMTRFKSYCQVYNSLLCMYKEQEIVPWSQFRQHIEFNGLYYIEGGVIDKWSHFFRSKISPFAPPPSQHFGFGCAVKSLKINPTCLPAIFSQKGCSTAMVNTFPA